MPIDSQPENMPVDSPPDGMTIRSVGDRHTLFDADNTPVKVWTGDDEDHASQYTNFGDDSFLVQDPDGTVTAFDSVGRPQQAVLADHTELDFLSDGTTLQTVADQHTLFGPDSRPVKVWAGDDADHASLYTYRGDGSYSIVDPDHTVTEFDAGGHAQQAVLSDGTEVDFLGDGMSVQSVGDRHTLFGRDGQAVSTWLGDDAVRASMYSHQADGSYSIVDPDHTVTEFDAGGHAQQAVLSDGTEVDFLGDGMSVQSVGDRHTLYGSDGQAISTWVGDSEDQASMYSHHRDGSYSIVDPDHTVTDFDAKGHAQHVVLPDDMEVDYRSGGLSVQTVDGRHTLYGRDGQAISTWVGDNEDHASLYSHHRDGSYSIVDADGRQTDFDVKGRPEHVSLPDGTEVDFRSDGLSVQTVDDRHTLFGADGKAIRTWSDDDGGRGLGHSPQRGESLSARDPEPVARDVGHSPDGQQRHDNSPGGQQDIFHGDGSPVGGVSQPPTADTFVGHVRQQPQTVLQHLTEKPLAPVDGHSRGASPAFGWTSAPGDTGAITQREGGYQVQTVGEQHTLFGPDGKLVKTWTGADESKALTYRDVGNQQYTLTDPSGKVTTYDAKNRPLLIVEPGKQDTTIEYREDGMLQTQGGVHTLYDAQGRPLTRWTGNDVLHAETWTYNKDHTTTRRAANGTETVYGPDGSSLTTTIPHSGGGEPTVIHWAADLDALHTAIGEVKGLHQKLREENVALKKKFELIIGSWHGPSGESFVALSASFNKVATTLSEVLDDAVRRMQDSYNRYLETEAANKAAMTPR